MKKFCLIAAILAAGTGQALAQSTTAPAAAPTTTETTTTVAPANYSVNPDAWRYTATVYVWVPGIDASVDTAFGTINSSSSASDSLSDLRMAFMGTFAASKGPMTYAVDLLYANLSSEQKTPFGALFSKGKVDTKLGAITGYALYNVSKDTRLQLDLGVGVRFFDATITGTLKGGLLPTQRQKLTGSWADPLLAARIRYEFDEKWFLNGIADFGGTSSSNQTWQLYGAVGYNFNERWSTQVGYRTMDIKKKVDGRDTDTTLSGVLVGVTYTF